MFINDKIAYVQLQKTASTHIASVLHTLAPGQFRPKHSPIMENVGERLVVGSVRNPWDWYISLWAYGCLGRGAMHAQLTYSAPTITYRMARASLLHPGLWLETARKIAYNAGKDQSEWIGYYADAKNSQLFRGWLKALLSVKGKRYLMEDYPTLPLKDFAGLMTFRFLRLHVDWSRWRRDTTNIRSQNDLRHFYNNHGIIDRFIRMERLEDDLGRILDEVGIAYTANDLKRRKKTNASEHWGADFYYDHETIDLVAAHESLIIEKFCYEAPATRAADAVAY